MPKDTLLATLTLRFSTHPENIATESLLHILRVHQSSGDALVSLLSHAGLPNLGSLFYHTQVYGVAGSIPDLVGTNQSGQELLVIEAKFWAHLTENQPETYLARLPETSPAVLLFVCPESRRRVLWDQLMTRVRAAGYQTQQQTDSHTITWTQIEEKGYLAIVSWRAILGSLSADAAAHSDASYLADTEQLLGLCERMDTEAFLPLRPEELSQEIGRRVFQFAVLVDEVVAALTKREHYSTEGLKTGGSGSGYGRYFKYKNRIASFLHYSPMLWGSVGASPIWLQLQSISSSAKWMTPPSIAASMRRFSADRPSLMTEFNGYPNLAITLECGLEKIKIIDNIVEQIIIIINAIDSEIQNESTASLIE